MRKVFYFILIITLYGCVEEFDLKIDDAKSKIVIEGLIENTSGPHYIRLTKSNAGVFSTPSEIYPNLVTLKPISNALVIISDNTGQIDTLKPIKSDRDQYIFDESLNATVKYIKDDNGNIIDTIYLNDVLNYHIGGFYKTSHLIGVPERTYTLKVVTKEKETFIATDYMYPTAKIDSIGFEKKVSEKDGQEGLVPLLYFKDPQKDVLNQYLFQLQNEEYFKTGSSDIWEISIFSDKNTEPTVSGLNLDDGAELKGFNFFIYSYRDELYFKMNSLSPKAYKYYDALLNQFDQDGGVYHPSPSSPPTNISNGGLGFFRASAITEITVPINRRAN
ncbi:DUF4249 family protein [Polaribacter cellanae]|uniref:DUF4249 domain-containing protein n=1 Tax=Polaribacter cellanae TaxID=2818493 RepID=A0A975CRX8_9FLAO|nr:DUF4249 family protein [Polaribacter cellanae]QTE22136.1 DUF4249 domain-containing protein [Polaribacter cellanae]